MQLIVLFMFVGETLEVDIWIPELNIGFEYQDKYHYISTRYAEAF